MYLIDTNIFLEILLGQDKCMECEAMINLISKSNELFYVSSFTIHSIEVVMTKNVKIAELLEFLSDIASSKIIRIETNSEDEMNALNAMAKLKLDFDDGLQYYACKKYNLKIISYDKHFDKTSIKRLEPTQFKR